jgi:hypothetical protein
MDKNYMFEFTSGRFVWMVSDFGLGQVITKGVFIRTLSLYSDSRVFFRTR